MPTIKVAVETEKGSLVRLLALYVNDRNVAVDTKGKEVKYEGMVEVSSVVTVVVSGRKGAVIKIQADPKPLNTVAPFYTMRGNGLEKELRY